MTVTISKRTERSNAEALRQRRIDSLVWIGGGLILLDTLWGALADMGLDSTQTSDLVLAISFILGLPAYLLDVWFKKRVAYSLLGVFLFRWIVLSSIGPTFVLQNPVTGNLLLIASFVLLQLYKTEQPSKETRQER